MKRYTRFIAGGLLVLLFAVFLIGCGGSGQSTTSTAPIQAQAPTQQQVPPTPTPTEPPVTVVVPETPTPAPVPPKWTVVQSFKGNGQYQTPIFTISDDVLLKWTGDPASFSGIVYNLGVFVYRASDHMITGVAINALVKDGNTAGETELHGDEGAVYFVVNCPAAWTLTVSELK